MRRQLALATSVLITAALLATCGTDDTENVTTKITPNSDRQTPSQETTTKTTTRPTFADYAVAPDLSGNGQRLTQWIGKQPVVINFWGTWCGPCRREIPDLVQLYDEYKSRGVEIVSLAMRDRPEQVRSFAAQNGMDWVHLLATQQAAEAFGYSGSVPTTIFYDRNGTEVARFTGARNYQTFKKAFEQIAAS